MSLCYLLIRRHNPNCSGPNELLLHSFALSPPQVPHGDRVQFKSAVEFRITALESSLALLDNM